MSADLPPLMQAPEDEGLESKWTEDEPSGGVEERVDQAPLGEDALPLSRAAPSRMQLRARVLPPPRAGTPPPSSHKHSSEDCEEPSAQAGHGDGDTRGDAVKYVGVLHKPHENATNPYYTYIDWQAQRYSLGYFLDAVSAAKARDWAARLVGDKRKLNFDRMADLGTPPSTEGAVRLRARVSQVGGTAALERAADARYLGVSRYMSNRFRAQVQWRGNGNHLGFFSDARSAAKAYDWAARLIDDGRLLNFGPDDDLGAPPTAPGADRLRKDVAAAAALAARNLGPGAAPQSAPRRPTLPFAALPRAAGAAAKRPARAPPPPAAKKRRAPPAPQPTPRGAGAPALNESGPLACQLRVLLRLRGLREDDLALGELGKGALRDITADVRRAAPTACESTQPAAASLDGYSALELQARLAVNMRLQAISEEGVRLDLLTGEVGRSLLLDVLNARGQDGGSA